MKQHGSLACVGLGMMLGAHLSPRSRSHIEQADVVFALVSDPLVELWLQDMRPDMRSLQPYYAEGKPRTVTYRQMVEAMLAEVRAGRRVCGGVLRPPGRVRAGAAPQHRAGAGRRLRGPHGTRDLRRGLPVRRPGDRPGYRSAASTTRPASSCSTSAASTRRPIWCCGRSASPATARWHASPPGPAYRRLLVELLAERLPADPRSHRLRSCYPSDHDGAHGGDAAVGPRRCGRCACRPRW